MKPKGPQLLARWSKRERDLLFKWDEGCSKSDGGLLHSFLTFIQWPDNKSLVDELKARGYDLTTLRFSIRKLPPQEPGE